MRFLCTECNQQLTVHGFEDPFTKMLTHKRGCATPNLENKLALAGFEVDVNFPLRDGKARNQIYSYRQLLEDRNKPEIVRLMVRSAVLQPGERFPNAQSPINGDSVKKVFLPLEGLVAAPQKIAFGTKDNGDYNNEDDAKARLGGKGHEETGGSDNPMAFFSYQQELKDTTEAEKMSIADFAGKIVPAKHFWQSATTPQSHFNKPELFRRVSLYGNVAPNHNEFAEERINTDVTKYLKSINEYLGSNNHYYDPEYLKPKLIKNLWSLIHQLIKIHELLYLAKMVHGDMHSGNIKVIVINSGDTNGIIVKAFDFGKAKFKNQNTNYTKVDLEYLIQKSAVSGSTETLNRWKRGADNPRMVKHYPLHKTLMTLAAVEGKQNQLNKDTIDDFIRNKGKGDKFLKYLDTARLPPVDTVRDADKRKNQISAISNAFEVFANRLVEQYYSL